MSVRAAIISAIRSRYRESTAIFPDQIRASLEAREQATHRLQGYLLMNIPDRDRNEIKHHLKEMNIHIMALPAVREKYRRNMERTQREIEEWYISKENEINIQNTK